MIEKRKHFGPPKKEKNPNYNFKILKSNGGVSIFQKCLNYKLLFDPILKKKKKHT